MKAQDLDWLRDGGVNLLSLDLGRWTDINVIDDKRVGDLIRELPAANTAGALTLERLGSLAWRGALAPARLVMGDFYQKSARARGSSPTCSTCGTGTKLRSVVQEAGDPDSLLTAFGPLARGVLAVPPPPDAKLGALGTTKIDAYQAYLAGIHALNRFDIDGQTSVRPRVEDRFHLRARTSSCRSRSGGARRTRHHPGAGPHPRGGPFGASLPRAGNAGSSPVNCI